MNSKNICSLQEAYLNIYEGRGARGVTSAESENLSRYIARRAKKNPQNTDKYWSGVLRLAGRAPSGSSVIDNAKREFIKKEDLDIVSGYHLDEGEKPFPYGKVGDKLRSLAAKKNAAKTPQEKNKIATRQEIINKEYNVPMEQVDLHDIVLSHLLDEGYAETYEAAEKIMIHMSEDWVDDIINEVVGGGHIGQDSGRFTGIVSRSSRKGELNRERNAQLKKEFGSTGVGPTIPHYPRDEAGVSSQMGNTPRQKAEHKIRQLARRGDLASRQRINKIDIAMRNTPSDPYS